MPSDIYAMFTDDDDAADSQSMTMIYRFARLIDAAVSSPTRRYCLRHFYAYAVV